MRTLKVTQCQVGHFDLLDPGKKSFSFQMRILDDGKLVERDGVPAMLDLSGDPKVLGNFVAYTGGSHHSRITHLECIFRCCFDYAMELLYSSRDYRAQCLAFATEYIIHCDEIHQSLLLQERAELKRKIEELQARLDPGCPSVGDPDDIRARIEEEIEKDERLIRREEGDLSQYVEGSQKSFEAKKRIERYKTRIREMRPILELEPDTGE